MPYLAPARYANASTRPDAVETAPPTDPNITHNITHTPLPPPPYCVPAMGCVGGEQPPPGGYRRGAVVARPPLHAWEAAWRGAASRGRSVAPASYPPHACHPPPPTPDPRPALPAADDDHFGAHGRAAVDPAARRSAAAGGVRHLGRAGIILPLQGALACLEASSWADPGAPTPLPSTLPLPGASTHAPAPGNAPSSAPPGSPTPPRPPRPP